MDNLLCEGQEVPMPVFSARKLMLLGFAEYSSFVENLLLRYADGTEKVTSFTLYGISENLETLYESELDSNTTTAFQARGKFSQRVKYYICTIALEKPLESVVLPQNSEIHIAAMTLSK
jgi:hypothetical protein